LAHAEGVAADPTIRVTAQPDQVENLTDSAGIDTASVRRDAQVVASGAARVEASRL
jgi:hypothetical protein